MKSELNIPHKANRILNLVLLAFILILIRTWYLGFVQGDFHREQSKKPQRRTSIEKVERATIRDRFNIPLAQNKIMYCAAIRYADIRDIPSHRWEIDPQGKKQRKLIRGPYITSLSKHFGSLLGLDSQDIEDTIYAKASLFPHTPFIIKECITEKQYYQIRAFQKDWPGIEAIRTSKRVYPLGKVACDLVGHMGPISSSQYLQIAEEIKQLEEYIRQRESGQIVFLPPGYTTPLSVHKRLQQLKEKAYTINDLIGKTGVEGKYDEILRGIHGKKTLEISPKGTVLRELPGVKKGISGQRIFLSISAQLQEFAEMLLSQNEEIRDLKDASGNSIAGTPWIKGGAIVVLDPKTGEVLTLASYPRQNPNDFIPTPHPLLKIQQEENVHRWTESQTHIADIWNGKTSRKKEFHSPKEGWIEKSALLTWEGFLKELISAENPLWHSLRSISTIKNAYDLQKHFSLLLSHFELQDPIAILDTIYSESPHVKSKKHHSAELLEFLRNKWATFPEELQESFAFLQKHFSPIPHNEDKLLLIDLTRLLIVTDAWNPSSLEKLGNLSLSEFFSLNQSLSIVQAAVKKEVKKLHHSLNFQEWRDTYFKKFLAKKRKEEKAQKKYAKPYTYYLEKVENSLFNSFWNSCRYLFLDVAIYGAQRVDTSDYQSLAPYLTALKTPQEAFLTPHFYKLQTAFSTLDPLELADTLKTMRSFEELNRPLYGRYRMLRNKKGEQLEKHLAAAFYPQSGFGYGRSQAFRQSTPLGSIFKLVVAYEALKERFTYLQENFLQLQELNPLTIIDHLQSDFRGGPKQILGYTLDGQPIRRLYKGGIIPRSSHSGIGKVDLIGAIEQSSNLYFSLLAAEHIEDPSLLAKTTRDFGFGSKTGIDLDGEFPGSIPGDLADNKTGLYSFAIGQHSLVGTPLQAAMMLGTLGNNGIVTQPRIVRLTAGKNREEAPLSIQTSFPFQDPLSLIGIEFPLFSESLSASYNASIHPMDPILLRSIFLPPQIRHMLFTGMHKAVFGTKGTARPSIIRYFKGRHKQMQDYVNLQGQWIGKTGTAEISYRPWIDAGSSSSIHNHIWFGGLLFPEGSSYEEEDAELVVVVYLRFSEAGGKEAAPLASQIALKWREIRNQHLKAPLRK